ncbi:SAM-dependent methyltransferase [Nonomuraea polychroma]|uniref:SAM-dependent methyltransferase n=1 Tax=Nonomuraea polychroma TaxID=46176 RepID=UPI003D8FEBF6
MTHEPLRLIQAFPPGIDPDRPHQARVQNYLLGGKDNYPADRAFAEQLRNANPGIDDIARHARAFLGRAVRHLTHDVGVRQFLDIGAGLPTVDNTHEIAQRADPTCRIVYVDNDPHVMAHARALLTSHPRGVCAHHKADVRNPDSIVDAAAETLDLTRPTALLLLGVMGNIIDNDEAYALVTRLLDALPSGSYLVLEDGTSTVNPAAAAHVEQLLGNNGTCTYRLRTAAEIGRFFDGLELLEPGVIPVSQWRLEADVFGVPDSVDAFGGVACKP